jgi:hypothetical protein
VRTRRASRAELEREPYELPDDHVHSGAVVVSVFGAEDGALGVLLEVAGRVAVLTADEAMAIHHALLRAAADANVKPARRGHAH